jgi:hypothetical protein
MITCTSGKTTNPTLRRDGERPADQRTSPSSSAIAIAKGIGREDRRASGEREDAAAAAEAREHRATRGRPSPRRHPTYASPHTPGFGEQGIRRVLPSNPFATVADEHGHRRSATERLASVPEAGIAVTDVAQVDARPAGRDEVGDRDRSDRDSRRSS